MTPKPLILIILDGWGYRAETKANAIALARKPVYDRLLREYPNTLIQTSGPYVGLPEGQMGNSEVGHLNIGAGRIVHMDNPHRADDSERRILSASGFVGRDEERARWRAPASSFRLALRRWRALLPNSSSRAAEDGEAKRSRARLCARVYGGRDTLPTNGAGYIEQLQQAMREYNTGKIAAVSGRYYAMDRDRRWERIAKAYNAMVLVKRKAASTPIRSRALKSLTTKA